ncbi:MAG: alternate-type signal peptide domain-containing protein [Micropruina sp.]|uniref:alternate-type signal peptide domain-containing protein n=1 Tax=Micropruina sp. TaxID=2737536 RepID=UPI0039E3598D
MKKTTKGVIASGVAVVLLLGGGSTLAYWNDSANLGGSNTITAGTLTVVANGTPAWNIQHTSGAMTAVPDINVVRVVPGDVLTYTVPATITARGQNLRFQVGLAGGSIAAAGGNAADAALAGRLANSAVFAVTGATPVGTGGDTFEHKNNASGNYTATITATITWPFGAAGSPAQDNPAKTGAVNLSNFALTVTQVDGSITIP